MKIAIVSSEATPYAKTGGLADVVGALPKYLNELGINTTIFLPRYKGINGTFVKELRVEMQKTFHVKIFKQEDCYFIDYPEFFERADLYGTEKGDFPDNCERFILFCKAVTQLLSMEKYDIVHCHDWQSALIPLYIKLNKLSSKSVFTIHNLGYQGKFPASKFPLLGIGKNYFNPEGIEFYGDINFLKAGILYSDVVTTVSETYSQEIQTPELGFGLDGVLRKRSDNLYGIINGIDYHVWNPETDNLIYEHFNDFTGKTKNKIALTNECNLDSKRPLIGMISRIAQQKGFDILVKAFDEIIDVGFNFILLGFGEEHYYRKLKNFAEIYPHRISINIKFDNKLAHRIYAGSDFYLMPSMYEPCGLGQLISLRYGTLPIVRKTGGLADTVSEFNHKKMSGNGFLFEKYSSADLTQAVVKAYQAYCDQSIFEELSENCMKLNFSWTESARKYNGLYASLINP